MTESEKPSQGDESKFAAAIPSAVEYSKDGTTVEYTVVSNSDEARNKLRKGMEEATGGKISDTPPGRASGKSHAMPGKKHWNAVWEPKGPNLSWQKPQQN